MIVVIHFLVAAICLYFAYVAVRDPSRYFVLMVLAVGLGGIHGFIPAIANAIGMYKPTPAREFASFYCVLGIPLLLTGLKQGIDSPSFSSFPFRKLSPNDPELVKRVIFWGFGAIGLAGFIGSYLIGGASLTDVVESGRFAYRGSGGIPGAILRYAGLLCVFPGFLGFFISRKYATVGVLYALIVAAALFYITRGSRSNALGVIGAIPVGFMFSAYTVKVYHKLILFGFALGVFVLSISMYSARRTMRGADIGEIATVFFSPETYQNILSRDPLDYNEILVSVVDGVPKRMDYLPVVTMRRIAFFFVPSESFRSLKPEDANITIAREVFGAPEELRVSIPPSIPGDAYVNFWGFPGLIYLWLQGLIVGRILATMRQYWWLQFAWSPLLVHLCILGMRGQPYELTLQAVFVAAAVVSTIFLTNAVRPKSASHRT